MSTVNYLGSNCWTVKFHSQVESHLTFWQSQYKTGSSHCSLATDNMHNISVIPKVCYVSFLCKKHISRSKFKKLVKLFHMQYFSFNKLVKLFHMQYFSLIDVCWSLRLILTSQQLCIPRKVPQIASGPEPFSRHFENCPLCFEVYPSLLYLYIV